MDLIAAIAAAAKAAQKTQDEQGREPAPLAAATTNAIDPSGQRKVRATTEGKGGLTETDWAMRVLPTPYWDPPLPTPGMSLAVGCFSADPHDCEYQGVMVNRVNPPFPKVDPINDDWRLVPGIQTLQIGGDRLTQIGGNEQRLVEGARAETTRKSDDRRVDDDHTISVGKRLRLQNDAGAFIELTEAGRVVICDNLDHCITLGGGNGVVWDLNGDDLDIIDVGDVSIEGRSVIVVGSTDTDGDTNNTRGY